MIPANGDAPAPRRERHGNLLNRTLLVSGLTFASRILGFVREMLSAALFGATSPIFDAFLTAWRVPNLFRRFLGEGALSASLVSGLTEVDEDEGEDAGAALFLGTLRLASGILAVLCAVVMITAYFLPSLLSPEALTTLFGKDPAPVLELTIRVAPFVILICLSALISGALNVRGHFLMPNLGPVILNVAWILALVVIGTNYGWATPAIDATGFATGMTDTARQAVSDSEYARHLSMTRVLAWGVLISGLFQLLCQLPPLRKLGFLGAKPVTRAPGGPTPWSVLKTAAPLAFGAAVYQINVMVDGLMAEWLPDGGPTSHYYANRIQQFPLALIAIAAMNSVFPRLKELGHRGDRAGLRAVLDKTQYGVAFLALPASCGLFLLAGPMASFVFQHGAFDAAGAERVGNALSALSLALLPAGAVLLLTRAYYALDDYRTPVIASSLMLATNIALNCLFLFVFNMDVEGLALATAISSWGNLLLLIPSLRRQLAGDEPFGWSHWVSRLGPMAACSVVAAALAYGANAGVTALVADHLSATPTRGAGLLAASILGVGGYFALATALGIPEIKAVQARLLQRRESK
ncbi:MAG: putative peptidoglycan lipid II flippase [Bacteroidia bacterium]